MVAVQVLVMVAFSLSNPLLPLFLEEELGLARGREVELWAGLIGGAHFLTMAIFSPMWGNLADRLGRKPMVLRSTASIAVFSCLLVVVQTPVQLLTVRLLMGVLSGFHTTATALVGSVTPRERLGYALGLIGTGQVVGLVFGPLIGGVVGGYFGYRIAFLFTGLVTLIAFALTALFVREGFVRPCPDELRARPGLLAGIAAMARSRELMPMLVVLMLSRAAVAGIAPVTSLFIGELDVRGYLVPTMAGLAFSMSGVGAAGSAPILGRLSDRVGSRKVLIAALAGSAVIYLPQAFVVTGAQFLALRFLVGVLDGGIQPASNALVGRAAPAGRQSAAYGLMASAASFGGFVGPLLTGFVAASFGLRAVFIYTAAIVAFNCWWVVAKVREPEHDMPAKVAPASNRHS